MKEKLITVIIPTFGRSEFLIRAVRSVLNQSYQNFEIIIVDDNGRGLENQVKTYNKISDLLNIEKRIKYLAHDKNKNGSAARNTGIKHSKGEYICFLDDDDEFLKDKLFSQYKLLESLENDWLACYTGHTRCFDNIYHKAQSYNPKEQGDILFNVLSFSIDACSGSTLMIKRELLKKVIGFNENLKRHQDYEFLARVAYYANVAVIPETMAIIHVHDGSYRQKEFENIESTRLEYIKYIQPYLSKLSYKQKKEIEFINNYWILKRAIIYKKHSQVFKYFLLCKNPLITIFMILKDSIKFLKKGNT